MEMECEARDDQISDFWSPASFIWKALVAYMRDFNSTTICVCFNLNRILANNYNILMIDGQEEELFL